MGFRLYIAVAGFIVLAGDSRQRVMPSQDPDKAWWSDRYKKFRVDGLTALQKHDYKAAIVALQQGAEASAKAGEPAAQGRFLANLSTAYLLQHDSRNAIQNLLAARDLAGQAKDTVTMQAVEANLANLYVQTGDNEAATIAAMRGAAMHPTRQDPLVRVTTLLNFGRAISKTRGLAAAEPMFRDALWTAGAIAEPEKALKMEAEVLDLWGNEAAEIERYGDAEDMLGRAWWKRRAAKDPRITLTEGKLGRLYRKMGRYEEARVWMDRLLGGAATAEKIPVAQWAIVAEQAHVYAGEGRLAEAIASYRSAVELARRWREAMPPAERIRLGAERRLQDLFDGYLRTAGRMYHQRPDAGLSAEMFTLIQTTRAWSMEKSRDGGQADEALYAKARRLEGQWLGGNAGVTEELKIVRASILEQEAESQTAEAIGTAGRLEAPAAGEAVLTYWLDEGGSWLWVWTQKGLRVTSLPGRARILAESEAFRAAVAENHGDRAQLGEQLAATLFGSLRGECLRANRLEIVAEEGLFNVPFAALPGTGGGYLVERAEIAIVPNALRRGGPTQLARRFLAVADPVFNSADERRAPAPFWQRPVHAAHYALELPRLPGTRREAEAARETWRKAGFETAIQLGPESSEEAVLARLAEWKPAIVHFATHTIAPPDEAARPRLALSLRPNGTPGLLAAEDIAALPLHADLVVMSACRSAGGETARGAGLLGLTRAWLTGGARQVLATLWPVGDESTAFFAEFYGRLAADGDKLLPAASALRQAQLACLRGGGKFAEPRYWAGHVLLARR